MKLKDQVKQGEGPFWRRARRIYYCVLGLHMPVLGPLRLLWRGLYKLHVFLRESWIQLIRFCYFEPLFRSQCTHVGDGLRMEQLPYIQGQGRIFLGVGVRFSGKPSFSFGPSAGAGGQPEIHIGDHTFIGHACGFNIGKSIRIGRHCLFSTGVHCYDLDGHPLDAGLRRAGCPTPPDAIAPIIIGDDVWVGNGALILKGVQIGDRAIIGARSVVTKDVPADTIVAGNPARVVAVPPVSQGK